VPGFSYIFCNSYGPVKFIEVATSYPLYAKKPEKILTCLSGAKKFRKLLLVFLTDSVFCCFELSFESQDDFLSLLIFGEY
jgi:hypothetical protein